MERNQEGIGGASTSEHYREPFSGSPDTPSSAPESRPVNPFEICEREQRSGLPNRNTTNNAQLLKAFQEQLAGPLGVMYRIDLDDFSTSNKFRNAWMSNAMLLEIGRLARIHFESTREGVVFHIGGDEFAIVAIRDSSAIESFLRDYETFRIRLMESDDEALLREQFEIVKRIEKRGARESFDGVMEDRKRARRHVQIKRVLRKKRAELKERFSLSLAVEGNLDPLTFRQFMDWLSGQDEFIESMEDAVCPDKLEEQFMYLLAVLAENSPYDLVHIGKASVVAVHIEGRNLEPELFRLTENASNRPLHEGKDRAKTGISVVDIDDTLDMPTEIQMAEIERARTTEAMKDKLRELRQRLARQKKEVAARERQTTIVGEQLRASAVTQGRHAPGTKRLRGAITKLLSTIEESQSKLSPLENRIRALESQIENDAMKDPVSGALNRSAAKQLPIKPGTTLRLLHVEVVHLGPINNQLDYGCGDGVLAAIREACAKVMESERLNQDHSIIEGRKGGEFFIACYGPLNAEITDVERTLADAIEESIKAWMRAKIVAVIEDGGNVQQRERELEIGKIFTRVEGLEKDVLNNHARNLELAKWRGKASTDVCVRSFRFARSGRIDEKGAKPVPKNVDELISQSFNF